MAFPNGRIILEARSDHNVFVIYPNCTDLNTHDITETILNNGAVSQVSASTTYSVTYRYIDLKDIDD